jgi:hypothetical protein
MSFGVICEINEKNEPGRSQLHMLHPPHLALSDFPPEEDSAFPHTKSLRLGETPELPKLALDPLWS